MPTITQLRHPPSVIARTLLAADHSAALDKVWFAENPQRSYRARPATPAELAKLAACNAMPPLSDDGMQVWTVVHQVTPGIRLRRYCAAAARTNNLPEKVAHWMWKKVTC